MATPLYEKIYAEVSRIPRGRISTYGSIAKRCDLWRGARLVGWALKALPPTTAIPWHRVVNRHGQLSIQNMNASAQEQGRLLEQEDIRVIYRNGIFSVPDEYQWNGEDSVL